MLSFLHSVKVLGYPINKDNILSFIIRVIYANSDKRLMRHIQLLAHYNTGWRSRTQRPLIESGSRLELTSGIVLTAVTHGVYT